VIDLSVIWYAWTGKALHEKPDFDCVDLWLMIQRTCERVIVTDEINRAYLELYEKLRDKYPQGPKLFNAFVLYFRWKQTKKVDDDRLGRDVPPLNDESEIEDEDKKFPRLAKHTNAVLVTHDADLIRLGPMLGYRAMKPSDVLKRGEQGHSPPRARA
jgi:hypothetical protein